MSTEAPKKDVPKTASKGSGCTAKQTKNNMRFIIFIAIGVAMIIAGYIVEVLSGYSVMFMFDLSGLVIGVIIGMILYYVGWLFIAIGVVLFFYSCYFHNIRHGMEQVTTGEKNIE